MVIKKTQMMNEAQPKDSISILILVATSTLKFLCLASRTICLLSMCCSWLVSFHVVLLLILFMACCVALFSTSTKPSHALANWQPVDVLFSLVL